MRKLRLTPTSLLGAALTACSIAALGIYLGASSPLTDDEIDRTLARIEAQTHTPGGQHDLPALRRFLEEDDGRSFYTVNLYEFNESAQYLDERAAGGTGREAYDRFSQVMVRLLARRSSHPIFGSDWIDPGNTHWDRIVVVRYRSRRDIAEIFASAEFAEASAHKWAALKRNDRLLVQGLHLPELGVPGSLLAAIGVLTFLFARQRSRSDRTPTGFRRPLVGEDLCQRV